MATQHESCQEEEQGSPYLMDDDRSIFPRLKWRDASKCKALVIDYNFAPGEITLGYKILWYFWSADIWFGRFPLLKFIVGVNVAVWIILFLTT